MSDAFTGEIRIFPFDFAPRDWASCDGRLLPISGNTALFSLLGTTYGGDGKSTFGLPDLRGRAPMQPGPGQNLSEHYLGEVGGCETVTLHKSEIPTHFHWFRASVEPGDNRLPSSAMALATSTGAFAYVTGDPYIAPMASHALAPAGSDQPHNNVQPYLTCHFCICLEGVHPIRP